MTYKVIQNTALVIMMLLLLLSTPVDSEKEPRCWKRKYNRVVGLPGVFDPACKKNITLHKCEGYCASSSGPVVNNIGAKWDFRCNCCKPKKYKQRTIVFPGCGTMIIYDIKRCNCLPC